MNESTDMEMAEVEAPIASPATALPSVAAQINDVGGLLGMARQLVDQGKPSQALQAVVMAMRTKGGEEAVIYILQRARELYRSKIQATAEADQLASLFAECAIAEAQPVRTESCSSQSQSLSPVPTPSTTPAGAVEGDACRNSILAETGRKQVVLDAFSDGSSFICLKCGGLVSNHRKDEHYAYWCQY